MDNATYEASRHSLDEQLIRFKEKRPQSTREIPALPFGRYSDPAFYELELEHLWPRTWVLAGHDGELPERGSYQLWRNLGVPILLVRGEDDRIRAFYNVCRHRAGSVVPEECGTTSALQCVYHGWTYDLTGKLAGVPLQHEFPQLRKEDRSLIELRCETWGTLIFVNRDPAAPTLREFMGERLYADLSDYDFDRRIVYHTAQYDVPTNWKYVFEAFIESYHARQVHAGTFASTVVFGGAVNEPLGQGHSLLLTPMVSDDAIRAANPMLEASTVDPRHRMAQDAFVSYGVFPNLAGAFSDGDFALFTMWPQGIDRTQVDIYYLALLDEKGVHDKERSEIFLQSFPAIMDEDLYHLQRSAEGLRSGVLDSLTLGYAEILVQQFNEQVDRVIGPERIPERLRVTPYYG